VRGILPRTAASHIHVTLGRRTLATLLRRVGAERAAGGSFKRNDEITEEELQQHFTVPEHWHSGCKGGLNSLRTIQTDGVDFAATFQRGGGRAGSSRFSGKPQLFGSREHLAAGRKATAAAAAARAQHNRETAKEAAEALKAGGDGWGIDIGVGHTFVAAKASPAAVRGLEERRYVQLPQAGGQPLPWRASAQPPHHAICSQSTSGYQSMCGTTETRRRLRIDSRREGISLADGAVHAPGYTMAWDEACGITAARLLALPRQAAFYGSVKARKRRFAAHCGRQRALHRMADLLRYGRGEGKKTVVGIGPGGFDSGSSPVKAFTQHLLRCKDFLVVNIDEWCTSRTCAGCHSRLKDNLRGSWKLKGCVNPRCQRTAWNRDVNAAINIERRLQETLMDFAGGDTDM
jgi:hypothetical protein